MASFLSSAAVAPAHPLVTSFDVFDTVLLRGVARPTDAFVLVAERLVREAGWPAALAAQWPAARVDAERTLRAARRGREVRLAEIVDVVRAKLDLEPAHADQMSAAELAVEADVIVPVPGAADRIAKAREDGRLIAFTSDVYLPEAFVRAQLEKHRLFRPGDALFVSSTSGATKHRGDLFRELQRHFGTPCRAITHVGDNRRSDYAMPRRLGMCAALVRRTRLSRYEETIAWADELPLRTRSLLAGAARHARLAVSLDSRANRVIAQTTAGVIAPLVLMFVAWTFAQAHARRLSYLYFLARDGQAPFRVAHALASHFGAGAGFARPHYLHASRQAWHPAAISGLDAHDLRWIFADHSNLLTLERLARRCNVDPVALARTLPAELAHATTRRIDRTNRPALIDALTRAGPARDLVLARAAALRHKVRRYLHEQGAALDTGALVDIGWHGSLQASFERILFDGGGGRRSTGLYFGLLDRPALHPQSAMLAWFADRTRSRRRDWLCAVDVLEQFFEADHGTTIGYEEDAGVMRAVLRERTNAAALAWGLDAQHKTIGLVCQYFLQQADRDDVHALGQTAATGLVERLLDAFLHSPTRLEAECYGRFPKTSNQDHDDHREMAPRLDAGHALLAALAFARDDALPTRWVSGSLVRTGLPLTMLRRMRLRLSAARADARLRRSRSETRS